MEIVYFVIYSYQMMIDFWLDFYVFTISSFHLSAIIPPHTTGTPPHANGENKGIKISLLIWFKCIMTCTNRLTTFGLLERECIYYLTGECV